MKKAFSLLIIGTIGTLSIKAQTVSQYTMWYQNHYLVNPAAAGNLDYLDVGVGFRRQWAGVKNVPQTFYATAHSVLNRPKTFERSALRLSNTQDGVYDADKDINKPMLKHALGGSLNTSEFGAFKNSSAMLTYALHLPVFDKVSLSFGLSGGLNNYGFDQGKATVIESNDPIYNAYAAGENSNKFNVNAGTYLYSDKFFFGYSANQLLQNKLEIADIQTTGEKASLEIHHFIMGGYHFDLSNDWRLTPAVLLKKLNPNPISYDINATLTYKQTIYGGIAYRNEDAISLMFGMQFNHLVRAGYAYDFGTSELSKQASGSHEIFIGLTLF